MGLHSDAVDLGTVLFHELDDVLRTGGFGACGLDVVVVIEELCGRVGSCGCGECDGDVGGANGVIEDVGAVGAVFIESLGCVSEMLVKRSGMAYLR